MKQLQCWNSRALASFIPLPSCQEKLADFPCSPQLASREVKRVGNEKTEQHNY